MRITRMGTRGLLGIGLLAGALAAPVGAQTDDARWAPFVGCWVPTGSDAADGVLCFRPATNGVEMLNIVDGQVAATELIVADGVARPVSAEGCDGSERVDFSSDGTRIFTHSTFMCGSDARSGSGVMSFISPSEWVDVRALTIEGEPVAWAQRYEAASQSVLQEQGIEDPAAASRTLVRAARTRAAMDIEIGDVEEAASRVDGRAVEVWLAVRETEFDLTGAELVRLADAGLSESIIDVMVAVSYPDRFVLSPEGDAAEAERTAQAGPAYTGYRRGYGSYLFNPFRDPTGFRYTPLYSRFGAYGYGAGGYYGGYYGYVPATVIVQPVTPVEAQPRGRMVPGRGYTRDIPSGGNVGSSYSPPAATSGGSSGGGSDSSSGSSGGGGSSSSGRTAQPRN